MFKSVTLYTNQLKSLKRFYGNVLELNITEANEEQMTVEIGDSFYYFQTIGAACILPLRHQYSRQPVFNDEILDAGSAYTEPRKWS